MTLDMVIGLAVLAVAATIFVVYPALVVSGMCSELERRAEIVALMERASASANGDYPADAPDQDGSENDHG